MVYIMINLNEHENRVLNIVKGKFGLKNKSEAVRIVLQRYEEELLEPELRPEYLKKLMKIEKQRGIRFKNVEELRRRYG